jgi:hypothetical protein
MTPTRCPSCRRPVAFYVDRIGYVHSYCPEAERLAQQTLGPCTPQVWPARVEIPDEQLSLPKRRRNRARKTGTCPQRRTKTPWVPPVPTREQRMEGLRRYYLRKYGRAA